MLSKLAILERLAQMLQMLLYKFKEFLGLKYRHDFVRDVLFDIFRCAGVFVKKEASMNFFTDSQEKRSTLRLADVPVYEWVGGKHACVNLTRVSSLVGLRTGGFTVGQTTFKAASCKVAKHERASFDNQHAFIPFVFETLDFLASKIVDRLRRVQSSCITCCITWDNKYNFYDDLFCHPKKSNDTIYCSFTYIILIINKNST